MNELPELGVLDERLLSDGWPREAAHLTPWLAKNLQLLADSIKVPLEWEATEKWIDGFRADIVARIPGNNSQVVIENQLGMADHRHLGQLVTYLAGLEKAKVVIWVASNFGPAHRKAISWLNTNTNKDFAFVAVRLRLFSIGVSPLAPMFELVQAPDNLADWVKETGQASLPGPRAAIQREFWDRFVADFPDTKQESLGGGGSSRWLEVPAVKLVVSRWFANGSVGVFVRGPRSAPINTWTEQLDPYMAELETQLGVHYASAAYPFLKSLPIDTSDRANWGVAVKWLHDEAARYAAVLTSVMGEPA